MGSRRAPVFLVGCNRSGTTLARFLLDAHKNLACPPESKFIAGLQAFLEYPQAEAGLLSLGFTKSDLRREMRRVAEAFLGGYARRRGKRRWVDKTPNYYRLLPFIDEIFEGEALYLLIVRHPLDCIDSLQETFGDATPDYGDPEIARSVKRYGQGRRGWAGYWNEVNERLHVFSAAHPNRCHVFRYEDLVRTPAATLQRVFTFIGEKLPPDLVATALAKDHTPGFEDYKIRATGGIHADGVGKWKSWPAREVAALWRLVGQTAARFGYRAETKG